MADQGDVRRIALSLPETVGADENLRVLHAQRGDLKGFV
jgi:hypothetical protein